MATRGLFVNFTLEQVLAIQARTVSVVTDVKTITGYGDQGTSVTKEFGMPLPDIIAEVNYALRELDPNKYGSNRAGRRAHSNYGATTMKL